MLSLDMTPQMKTEIEKLLNAVKKKTHVYNLTMQITSDKVPGLYVNLCREITQITITQDFVRNFSDKITVDLTLDHRDPYVTIYHMRHDMKIKLTMSKVHPDLTDASAGCSARQAADETVLKFHGACIHADDLFKKIDVDRIWPDYHQKRNEVDNDRGTFKISLELIADDVFKARRPRLNDIFNSVNMLKILRYTCNFFGYQLAHIHEPDNTFEYTNFVIPPSYGIREIFSFYQNAPGLGVYNNGFCAYITRWWKKMSDNAVYIWPRYGKPCTENPVHIYSVGSNQYYGHKQCHYLDNNIMKIMVTDRLAIHNWSDLGTENFIDGVNVMTSEAIMDQCRKLIADENIETRTTSSQYVALPSDPIDTKCCVNIRHIHDMGNLFRIRSELRTFQGTSIEIKWHNAMPWLFTPSTEVQLHYDHPLGFKTKKGQADKVVYTLKRDRNYSGILPVWKCNAQITLNCDNIEGDKAHV